MNILKFPEWQKLCEEALSERDRAKVFQRVITAEMAIFRGLQDLKTGQQNVELRTMDATLQRLRLLIVHLRAGSISEDNVVTMSMRSRHNGLILSEVKRQSRPVSSGSDQPG